MDWAYGQSDGGEGAVTSVRDSLDAFTTSFFEANETICSAVEAEQGVATDVSASPECEENAAFGDLVAFCVCLDVPRQLETCHAHGAQVTVDIRACVLAALRARHGPTAELPSNRCFIDRVQLQETNNSFACDIVLECADDNRLLGTYSKAAPEDETTVDSAARHNALYVMRARHQIDWGESAPSLYDASAFRQSDHLRSYSSLLAVDWTACVSVMPRQKVLVYASPSATMENDQLVTGDRFLSVIWKNIDQLSHRLKVEKNSVEEENRPGVHGFTLSMHPDDFNKIHEGIKTTVLDPMRAHVRDLMDNKDRLTITFTPDVSVGSGTEAAVAPDTYDPDPARGVAEWQCVTTPGRAGVTLRISLRFIVQ